MSLTVREKEHWVERIRAKIDKAICLLIVEKDPDFLKKVDEQAKAMVVKELGLDKDLAAYEALEKQKIQLEADMAAARDKLAKVFKMGSYYRTDLLTIYAQIKKRAEPYRSVVLVKTALGKKVLALENEKETVLDSLWLATTTAQIKELWTAISEMLGDVPTDIEKKALDMPGVDE